MKPEQRRLLIMAAAEASFAARGFHGTTMNDIAHKSDISVGALYRYFASKDALITAIIQQSHQMAITAFAGGDNNKPVSQMLGEIFASLVDDPPAKAESALVAEVFAESFRNARVDQALSENEREMERWLAQRLHIAKEQGQLHFTCDPSSVALVLTALYDGLVLRASPNRSDNKEDVAKAIDHVIKAALSVS